MKRRLLVVLVSCSILVCSMASIASAETFVQKLDATIDYDVMSKVTADMTYREFAKLVFDKCSIDYTIPYASLIDNQGVCVYLIHNDFEKIENFECYDVGFCKEDLDRTSADFDEDFFKAKYSILDQKVKDGTVVKLCIEFYFPGYKTVPANEVQVTINGKSVDYEVVDDYSLVENSTNRFDLCYFEGGTGINELSGQPYDWDAIYEAIFYIGIVDFEVKGANTADNNYVALYSFSMLIALAGLTVLGYNRRIN